MLSLLSIAAVYGLWRLLRGARESLRALPRHNDDVIFF